MFVRKFWERGLLNIIRIGVKLLLKYPWKYIIFSFMHPKLDHVANSTGRAGNVFRSNSRKLSLDRF